MKLEIIAEKGQVRLATPVYLKPDAPHRFTIEIDARFVDSGRDWMPGERHEDWASNRPAPEEKPGSLQERLNSILGDYAVIRNGSSIGDDHQMLMEELEERYHGQ
ncbi:MAG: hypothetical protein U5R49_00360 [Deltaproteobacteria bacterium]|nr:hypothetical protein [Deltaproteobacteria bacterium]